MTTGTATAERPVRLGFIGCGNVLSAYRTTVDRLRARGWAEVSVACGREPQRAEAMALLQPRRFTTLDREVIDASDVDVVVILTSMNGHAALARAALDAGKHVLVEKPLATRFEEATALVEHARNSPGHLVCAPFTLLSPTFRALASRIQNGDIGKPCLARARYGWSGPWWSEWFYRPGGGCLLDLGVYCLTSLTGLLGPARRVTAMSGVAIPEREIQGRRIRVEAEDNAQVLLDFGDATFAVVTTGFTMQQYRNPALEVYGTTGTVQMLGDDWDPNGYELWQNQAGCWQVYGETDPDWPWTDGLRHLVECIRNGTRPSLYPEHALHVLEIILKAQESGRDGHARTLNSTFPRTHWGPLGASDAAHLQHDRTRDHSANH